jgi:hypothetical protein
MPAVRPATIYAGRRLGGVGLVGLQQHETVLTARGRYAEGDQGAVELADHVGQVREPRVLHEAARPAARRRGSFAHGAIKAYFLLYTTCTHVQTVSLNPYSCTGGMTPSVHVYTPDGLTRTAVQPASLQTCTQLCGRCNVCRTPVHSDSFAMRSSTYYLAGSRLRLTFEIMCFGSNTSRDF